MIKKILIVCVGNVCRSPMAEYLLRRNLGPEGLHVDSAGLGALVGHPMDGTVLQLLAEQGVDGRLHSARQLSVSMMRSADLVLAMERDHVSHIVRLAPEFSGKVMLLDRWGAALDIPDPHRQGREAFEHVFGLIDHGVQAWMKHLYPHQPADQAQGHAPF